MLLDTNYHPGPAEESKSTLFKYLTSPTYYSAALPGNGNTPFSRMLRMVYHLLERSALVAIRTLLPYLISASARLSWTVGYLSQECTAVLDSSTATYAIHSFFRAIMAPFCKVLAICAAFTSAIASERVDTHIHALPAPYIEALKAAGGDPSGYPTPNWSLQATIDSMNQVNTDIGE